MKELVKIKTISYKLSILPIRNIITIAFLLSTSLVAFILIFQPYDYNRLSFWISFELISIVFISTFLFSVVCLISLRSRFAANVWYILLLWFFYTGIISQVIYSYTIVKGYNDFSWNGVGIYFITSLMLSIIPVIILLFLRKSSLVRPEYDAGKLKLNGLTLPNDKILLFKAEDNYVKITYLNEEDELKSTMVRTTMKEILKAVGNQMFLRVHRSYVINLDYFSHYSGKAKGYFAHLNHLEQKIPVSRSNGNNFLKRIRSISH